MPPTPGAPTANAPKDGGYARRSVMIPMRDGVRLSADIYRPRDSAAPLPILFFRTPFGVGNAGSTMRGTLADDGYIFVFQDVRGRNRSEGSFVPRRPLRDARHRNDRRATDEATDAYDTIEWLLKNVPGNNGRVGMLGVSPDAWATAAALTDPHPALKAIAPEASPADLWLVDDFSRTTARGLGMEPTAMARPGADDETLLTMDPYENYYRFLKLAGSARIATKPARSGLTSWSEGARRIDVDALWEVQAAPSLASVPVPTLHVGGLSDEDDAIGPLETYAQLERNDKGGQNFLVLGPWNREGWWSGGDDRRIDQKSSASKFFRDSIQAPFFAYHLKGRGTLVQPEALVFDIGSNQWRRFEAWPPKIGVTQRVLYLASGGRLVFDKAPATNESEFDTFVLDDPHAPRLRRAQKIQPKLDPRTTSWYTWLTKDQSFVEARLDILSWKTEPLEQDVTIAGQVLAHLFASATAPEADWMVELIDVYPDGSGGDRSTPFSYMVSSELYRARFDSDLDGPSSSGKPLAGRYTLAAPSYRFAKGHRIMLQIESTWFPIVDRSAQTFLSVIFRNREPEFRNMSHRVYHSAQWPSAIAVPVVSSSLP